MNARKILGFVLIGIIIAATLFFATMQRSPQKSGLQVTATFYPLYEFAKAVGGDKATVTNLTPAGAEPHDYDPSPQDITNLQRSDIFIYHGGQLEPWVDAFLPDYRHTAVNASKNIEFIQTDGANDPHYWLDPQRAKTAVAAIRDAFIAAAPEHAGYFKQNAADYSKKLDALNTLFSVGLSTCHSRTVVTAHDAFGYVAARYNLDMTPIAGLSPEAEPSPAKLAEISKLVREKQITTIFFEQLASPRLAATIAQETGAKTAILDPIEGLTDEDQQKGKSYLSIQQDNLAALVAALDCHGDQDAH